MGYFEVVDPYYALIKAESKEDAKKEYNSTVADLDDIEDIFEVPENYDLVRFSQVPGEDKKLLDPKEILKEFVDPDSNLLIIDGTLM
ncbi:hypothetical protein [Ornithinibacillus xuwenensis]|uniref:Uncharacterized protein n=1 Tax=Ornithinibacillus xuwenensis TaxID=3144668 RepID=A0ABU9XBN3_9BACI